MAAESNQSKFWQKKLNEACKNIGIRPPWYQPYSDRRGRETAWTVHIILDHYGEITNSLYVNGDTNQNAVREAVAERAVKYIETHPDQRPPKATTKIAPAGFSSRSAVLIRRPQQQQQQQHQQEPVVGRDRAALDPRCLANSSTDDSSSYLSSKPSAPPDDQN